MDFFIYNGKIIPETDAYFGLNTRMNDFSISQDMWFANGEIPHFDLHFRELEHLLTILDRPGTQNYPSRDEILRISKRLINKNKAFMGGWLSVRFSHWRNGINYFITIKPCSERIFPFDPVGKTATISPFIKFSGNPLTRYSFFSESLWKTEQFRSGNSENEESFFLNEKGVLTEAIGTNLFFLHKNHLWTPAEETGCMVDIMREHVIHSARLIGFQIHLTHTFMPAEIREMEEIFLVSEGRGFKWIMGMGTKRFFKKGVDLIWRQLNKSCFPGIS
jgi:branched-subunit amino acid aminotransferase/4-amino-4-deoxychorismate lyase